MIILIIKLKLLTIITIIVTIKIATMAEQKNTPCLFFANGNCSKGDKCSFKHIKKTETKVCTFYAKGKCNNGDSCKFLHPAKNATATVQPKQEDKNKRSNEGNPTFWKKKFENLQKENENLQKEFDNLQKDYQQIVEAYSVLKKENSNAADIAEAATTVADA